MSSDAVGREAPDYAFPRTYMGREGQIYTTGMTLRDYFAAQAMTAMIQSECRRHEEFSFEDVAFNCYVMADHMIRERGIDGD